MVPASSVPTCGGLLGDGPQGCLAPIYTQPYIRERFGDPRGTLPVTESVAQRTIALPFHNNLSAEQVKYVCDTLKAVHDEGGSSGNAVEARRRLLQGRRPFPLVAR